MIRRGGFIRRCGVILVNFIGGRRAAGAAGDVYKADLTFGDVE